MPSLTEILSEAAGPSTVPFTSDDIRHRVTRRQQSRRRARLASAAAVLALTALGTAISVRHDDGDDGGPADVAASEDDVLDEDVVGVWTFTGTNSELETEGPFDLVLAPDGTVLTGGCDYRFYSQWHVDGGRLVVSRGVGDGLSLLTVCDDARANLDNVVAGMLWSGPSVAVTDVEQGDGGQSLELTAPDGTFMQFERGVSPDGDPEIAGLLMTSEVFTVADTPDHGLCLALRSKDLGCDDENLGLPAGADPATPRLVAVPAVNDISESPHSAVLFAYLPAGATTVVVSHADGSAADQRFLVVDGAKHMWALAIDPDNIPTLVVYLDSAGAEMARFGVPGG